jgi:hypothetical protein
MSTFLLFGFFSLLEGRNETIRSTGITGKSYISRYILYDTVVDCTHGPAIASTLRVHCKRGEEPMKNGSVACAVAAAYITPEGHIAMDAIKLSAIQNFSDERVNRWMVPISQFPFVFGLGRVNRSGNSETRSAYKTFDVTLSEFVRGDENCSSVQ